MYELEHGDNRKVCHIRSQALNIANRFKLVWFLAPTVTLCEQQHRKLQESFPAVYSRLIVGSDNVECWKTQDVWDDVLRDQRIVVTTHAILSDALFHGFVVMQRLALLIYDEGMKIFPRLYKIIINLSKRTIAPANIRQTRS
jgi:ERCC4-related helicase